MHTKLWLIGIIGIIGLMLFAQGALAADTGPQGEPELIFDDNGTIDRISNDDIVLDDSWYKLAAQVVYYNKDMFEAGTLGIVVDSRQGPKTPGLKVPGQNLLALTVHTSVLGVGIPTLPDRGCSL